MAEELILRIITDPKYQPIIYNYYKINNENLKELIATIEKKYSELEIIENNIKVQNYKLELDILEFDEKIKLHQEKLDKKEYDIRLMMYKLELEKLNFKLNHNKLFIKQNCICTLINNKNCTHHVVEYILNMVD